MPIKEITESFTLERIVPFFQPIMDLHAGSVWRYECLARLINEQEHTFLPSQFLSLVERNNWVYALTETMMLQSAQYFRHNTMRWNINLDTQDLLNPNLMPFIRDLIAEYPHSERISVELTAHAALKHERELTQFVSLCQDCGIGVFIDNLGASSVNIGRLLRLPITGVKLSGALIQHCGQDAAVRDFVEHVCEKAHEFNVCVVAEHIEDEAALALIKTLSIRYAQGFLFSHPYPTVKPTS
ncbi:EAL domain-containing protein [Alteromonas oceanisediminis]|uniref:EAL domain-containing protein n=1 Tax=Alteromonas oceanisediminis TaxID=2836180 RepID=UPI001BD91FD1|nr:EAL domain-containing protein [Alteromonas oceanisediminis]MBT0587678.1 EAL domain-containing protein [Alteromonas oceanisediminis]